MQPIRQYDETDPYDDLDSDTERFSRRHDRRRPPGRRTVGDLLASAEEAPTSATRFTDPDLQRLFERGYLDDLRGQLKSGKEATVYLVGAPKESRHDLLAAKVYVDLQVRSFKNDARYRQGRFIGDARAERAIRARSGFGREAQQALWAIEEYRQLWDLHEAGVPAPRPAVGPQASDIAMAGRVVLMEFIGDEDGPAPRLSDLRLSPDEAEEAWRQSVDILTTFVRLGKVHGDFSTYNLLWHEERVVVIDFPQVVELERNREAAALLEQDVTSLCTSFRRLGVERDPGEVLRALRRSL